MEDPRFSNLQFGWLLLLLVPRDQVGFAAVAAGLEGTGGALFRNGSYTDAAAAVLMTELMLMLALQQQQQQQQLLLLLLRAHLTISKQSQAILSNPQNSFALLAAPFLDAFQEAWLGLLRAAGWVGVPGFSRLAKGLELELGAWRAIIGTVPFQPQNLNHFNFERGMHAQHKRPRRQPWHQQHARCARNRRQRQPWHQQHAGCARNRRHFWHWAALVVRKAQETVLAPAARWMRKEQEAVLALGSICDAQGTGGSFGTGSTLDAQRIGCDFATGSV
eukprot:1145240-Pelagomonas_calceolata.AAC.2